MEVDLTALSGKNHNADEEKFSIPSGRVNESNKSNAFSSQTGGITSCFSQKKITS